MKHDFEFILALTEREIKARYKRAVFGFLWMILNPVFQMLIIGLIFSFFIEVPNYFLFLLTGLLPWQFFSLSLSKATPSFTYERAMLYKSKFFRASIPIAIILANFFHLMVALGLLLLYLLITQKIYFPEILILFPALVWFLVFTIGVSLLTSVLQIRFRDINFFVQALLILWFYATPILYNFTILPRDLSWIFSINPLSVVFEWFHLAILGKGGLGLKVVLANLAISVLIVFIGVMVYKKQSKQLVDWL